MKIICNKNELLRGVNTALRAIPVRTTMSILECILIDATEDIIKFTANDMELGIETIVEGEIIERGKIALEAKFLAEIIRKLPESEVEIESSDDFVTTITCGKYNMSFPGRESDDFSYLPDIEKEKSIVISQFTLKEIIRKTLFAVNDAESNKVMTGELFEINNDMLRVVGLDRYRVAINNIRLNGENEDISVIIPGKTLNEISKILTGDAESDVVISFSSNHVLFEFDNTVVLSRLIEGEFFKINQMISKDYKTMVTVNRKELIECIDRSTLLIKEGNKKPAVIDITDGNLNVSIASTFGKMNENIDADKKGDDIKIGLDPKYMLESLRVIDDDEISIYFMNSKAPCTIRDEEGNYIFLVLPVNY